MAFNPLDEPDPRDVADADRKQEIADNEAALDAAINKLLFHTAQGKLILEWMYRVADQQAGFEGALGFYDGAALGFELNGMRKLLREIRARSTRAEGRR